MDAVAAVEREMDDADCTQFEHMFTTIPHHSYHTTRLSTHTHNPLLFIRLDTGQPPHHQDGYAQTPRDAAVKKFATHG